MLVVLRAEEPLTLAEPLASLAAIGVQHVEIAWSDHPAWAQQLAELRVRHGDLQLGAASITSVAAVRAAAAAGLRYAMAPVFDPPLQRAAEQAGLLLVPGVFSPSEVHAAAAMGCRLVKLFPAASLGPAYWQRLRQPLGPLPFCIAAGGLTVADLDVWLQAGVDAVTLGAAVADGAAMAALAGWLRRWCCNIATAAPSSPRSM